MIFLPARNIVKPDFGYPDVALVPKYQSIGRKVNIHTILSNLVIPPYPCACTKYSMYIEGLQVQGNCVRGQYLEEEARCKA